MDYEYNTLKLTSPMMYGPAVKRLQELGDMIGFDGGPNDGILGKNTQQVILDIQGRLGLRMDGICGPVTWKALNDYASDMENGNSHRFCVADLPYVDIRWTHPKPKLYSRRRTWDDIVGVTLHQTGCEMPDNPYAWKNLNAHIGILQSGECVVVNDFLDLIYHAQGLSLSTIGIEIEGNFCGVDGDINTLWPGGGGPHRINSKMIHGLWLAFDFIKSSFWIARIEWLRIHAHRQSSKNRRADPGSEIWKKVAMPWAHKLGLSGYDGGGTWSKKKGLTIPAEWNCEYDGRY